jgi:hypothetical protein
MFSDAALRGASVILRTPPGAPDTATASTKYANNFIAQRVLALTVLLLRALALKICQEFRYFLLFES